MNALTLPAPACAATSESWSDADRDRALCDRALRGEHAAWNDLIRRHNRRVVVALLGRGIPMSRAQDLAQETWLRLIQQQREGKLTSIQLPGLAVTQACFLALEATRREQSERRFVAPEDSDTADPACDMETRLLSAERLEQAQRVLERSTASSRRVFELAYGGASQLSHADISQQVGLSLQRVRQILCELRQQMRSAIEGEG